MKKVLILIAERAAEGFRVADGLSLTEELDVSVLVFGAAAHGLKEETDRHLIALRKRNVPVFQESDPRAAALRAQVGVTIEF